MNPINREGYQLLHDGSLAFGAAERAGVYIDVEYCQKQIDKLEKKETKLTKKIFDSKAGKTWKRMYANSSKLGSPTQLREVMEEHFGIEMGESADKEALGKIDSPFTRAILRLRKIHKARTTYLIPILRHTADGLMHPFFNLHVAKTFRSSSSEPNFQNIPVRDPEVAGMIRRSFTARPHHRLVEADYSGVEVYTAACHHKDPTMIKYLKTGYDMHKQMAAECYMCHKDDVTKDMRYAAKNRFVFPEFYGSYYAQVAPDLWGAIGELKLKLECGLGVRDHLSEEGIENYDDFEDHIEKVEHKFWYKKFLKYTEWKDEWVSEYRRKGYFDTLTGFRCRGYMRRNQIINFPIQGSAFHILLWSFIQLHKEMRKRKMKSVLVAQIHDSILGDVHGDEYDEYIALLKEITTKRVRKHWPWIILPLEVDIEVAPVGGSWFDKEEIK